MLNRGPKGSRGSTPLLSAKTTMISMSGNTVSNSSLALVRHNLEYERCDFCGKEGFEIVEKERAYYTAMTNFMVIFYVLCKRCYMIHKMLK